MSNGNSSTLRSPLVLGNRTFDCSPLSDESKDALDEWIRSCYMERMRTMLLSMPPGAALDALANQVATILPSLGFMSAVGARFLGTMEGMARIVYEMARPNHPDLKYEDLKSCMVEANNVRAANAKFRELEQLDKPTGVPQEGKE